MTDLGPYAWLADNVAQAGGHPKLIVEALKEYGVQEAPGAPSNPKILAWAQEVGLGGQYRDDEEPWCGLFAAVITKRAGYTVPQGPLLAAHWAAFGMPSPQAALGDVLVFNRFDKRGNLIGGHVGIYVAEDKDAFHVLGGNESNRVTIVRVLKLRLRTVRRPPYQQTPSNVKPIVVSIAGAVSSNEA
jgi:uncharacterized protein (TIGR02594 family)